MQRQALMTLAATLAFGAPTAFAQDGDLSGVTMRVLDDISGIEAVVLELDANRGEGEESPESEDRDTTAPDQQRAADEPARAETTEEERRDIGRARDDLHDVDADERSEGRLEDRDVERPAAQPPAP